MIDSNISVDSGANPDTSTNQILTDSVQFCAKEYGGVIQIRQAKKGYQENREEATLLQQNNCKR